MKKIFLLFSLSICFSINAQNYKVSELKVSEELYGDLYDSANKESVILLIAGSGPTNRNGNSIGTAVNNSLKFLAQGLATQNYDVFTYDKRVVYLLKNNKDIPELDFKHGITDAETIVAYLKNHLKYKDVIIAGHSEGSLVGMVAAQKNAAAFVSLAGAGNSIDIILKKQLNKQAPMLDEKVSEILSELKKGNTPKDVPMLLKGLFGGKNQKFLMDWMSYNPTQEIAKLKIPVLIINGNKDIQVEPKEAELLHLANKKSDLVIIDKMNHVFKTINADEENLKSYTDPKLPINTELVHEMVNFLKKNKL